MDEVMHAIQVEPGRWRVHVEQGDRRKAMVMSALEFSNMLRGEPYKTDFIFSEWNAGPDEIDDGARLDG